MSLKLVGALVIFTFVAGCGRFPNGKMRSSNHPRPDIEINKPFEVIGRTYPINRDTHRSRFSRSLMFLSEQESGFLVTVLSVRKDNCVGLDSIVSGVSDCDAQSLNITCHFQVNTERDLSSEMDRIRGASSLRKHHLLVDIDTGDECDVHLRAVIVPE